MKCSFLLTLMLGAGTLCFGQQPTLSLRDLEHEAIEHNPEIRQTLDQMQARHAHADQAGAFADPELTYMREGMPDFRFGEAMFSRIELMQMIMFPTKLSTMKAVAEIDAEHSHHDHLEKVNEIIARVRMGYAELWFAQQSEFLARDNIDLMQRMTDIARVRYSAAVASQQEVLRASIELSKMENDLLASQQRSRSAETMLMSLLNRPPHDTLGTVSMSEVPETLPELNVILLNAAMRRPMLMHESLNVVQSDLMVRSARQSYLPDLKIGVQYMTEPTGDFRGWTVTAGITLPFAPWTLGTAASRVEEAEATKKSMEVGLSSARAMVNAAIRDAYFRAESTRRQEERYRTAMLPQSRQILELTVTAYENGRTDFLMLIDAYRTLIDLRMNALMLRMQFEEAMADLSKASGISELSRVK